MASGIRQWLDSHNLGQYADAFEENYIGLEEVPDLSEGDLKELGIAAMGHRKALLRAIAAHQDAAGSDGAGDPGAAVASNPARQTAQSGTAERRQLTVMFADLVGSTEMAGRLDPEDVREAITRYQNAVAIEVARFDGHVAKYMGDGVLCYFGWPRAHEDDAERAARAGLDLMAALQSLSAANSEPLVARVGIATGLVVVGDLIGEGAAQEEAVTGETPNLAARLQDIAKPGQVVVAGSTKRLLSDALDVEHIGQHDLKGISGPVDAYAILGVRDSAEIAARGQSQKAISIIGRENEIALLMERWALAEDGEGQVFLLSGEPGIGKSQISAGLLDGLHQQPHEVLQFQCSPYYASSAFYPVAGYLERAAGFTRGDDDNGKLDKLQALLRPVFGRDEKAAALFASMLSLPLDRFPPLGLEPLRQKETTIATFVDYVAGLSAKAPILFLFEDAHWCDATTIEMLTSVIHRVESLPVFLVITHRPEFEPPWQNFGHLTQYTLKRLAKRHSVSIVEEVTGGMSLPEKIVEQILAKTDGIPLFVEELTKTIIEAGFLQVRDGAYVLDGPLPPFAIPSTLQDSLMARLDRLSPVKEVAQTGACIGREFSYELLASVSPLGGNELKNALQELVNSELIFARGTPPAATYIFKHALVQDAAYGSLLKSRRQQFHTKIAQTLEAEFSTTLETEPELAAQHYTAAGLMEKAVPYWLAAGLLAIAKFANEEAINHLSSGLNCLLSLPDGDARDEQELLLRATLGVAQFTARGYGNPELGENYECALSIVRRIGDTPFRGPAMFGVWVYHLMNVNYAKATEVYGEWLKLSESSGTAHEKNAALAAAMTSCIFMGRAQEGLDFADANRDSYDVESHGELVALYGQDTGLWSADFGSWATWLVGRADEADRRYADAIRVADELGHPLSRASGLVHASLLYSMAGDVPKTLSYADKTIVVCEEVGIPARLVEAYVMKGWAMSEMGDIDDGIALTQTGMAGWRGAGAEIARPWWLALLSQQFRRKGDLPAALAALDEGLSTVERTGEGLWASELTRLRGSLLLDIDASDTEAAELHFHKAMAIAKDQPAKYWELRAATSLGRLWSDQREAGKAADMIRPIYKWFTEGHGYSDLSDAGKLLDGLGG